MLRSLLNQSRLPSEIIVVDDGSTDNSVQVLQRFAAENPIIRFLENGRNQGAEYSYNRGLAQTEGNYISLLSADDIYLPDFVEKTVSLLEKYPQAGLCCSNPGYVDGVSGMRYSRNLGLSNSPCYFPPDHLVELMRKKYVEIGGAYSAVKRTALLEAGGYLPGLKWHCDWFVLLVIAFRYGICYVPEPLVTKRVLPNCYSLSGVSQWPKQKKLLNDMLAAIKSPAYRDVFDMFKQSAVLAQLPRMFYVLLGDKNHWDIFTPLLFWRTLIIVLKSKINLVTPLVLKRLYNKIRFKWSRQESAGANLSTGDCLD
jgi:glycosyltransferase involved in cell wall biosynthesis